MTAIRGNMCDPHTMKSAGAKTALGLGVGKFATGEAQRAVSLRKGDPAAVLLGSLLQVEEEPSWHMQMELYNEGAGSVAAGELSFLVSPEP